MIRAFLRLADQLAHFANAVGAVLLALIAIFMLSEVGARLFFNRSLEVTWEIGTYFMTALIFLGAARTMRVGGHVRVALLMEVLGPRFARWLDLVASVVALLIVLYLFEAATSFAWQAFERGVRSFQPSRMPLWVPQSVLAVGLALLALQLMARILRLVRGEPAEDQLASDRTSPEGGRGVEL